MVLVVPHFAGCRIPSPFVQVCNLQVKKVVSTELDDQCPPVLHCYLSYHSAAKTGHETPPIPRGRWIYPKPVN